MRNLALGDVAPGDLRLMKAENETLFVEHKSSLDGERYNVAEAVASFANTLGAARGSNPAVPADGVRDAAGRSEAR